MDKCEKREKRWGEEREERERERQGEDASGQRGEAGCPRPGAGMPGRGRGGDTHEGPAAPHRRPGDLCAQSAATELPGAGQVRAGSREAKPRDPGL